MMQFQEVLFRLQTLLFMVLAVFVLTIGVFLPLALEGDVSVFIKRISFAVASLSFFMSSVAYLHSVAVWRLINEARAG